jgi:cytoskeletal protein CcmA (bactofilin family)
MKEKKREIDETNITGFFDKNTKINGELEFKGSFRIDGYFQGKINSESILIVGKNGKVEADIKVGNVIISGETKGNIHAKEKVEIHSSGRVFGNIISPKLSIEEGAYLEANCQTIDNPPNPIKESKPLEKEDEKPEDEI